VGEDYGYEHENSGAVMRKVWVDPGRSVPGAIDKKG